MEARKFDYEQSGNQFFTNTISASNQPFAWSRFADLVHPLVWAWIAALWLGLAWVILSEIR
jgi:hypothetical protein